MEPKNKPTPIPPEGNSPSKGEPSFNPLSRAYKEQVWVQRAAQMAKVDHNPAARGDQVAVVLLCLGRELVGLEVQYVFDIRPCGAITRVPSAPHWVVGVTNLRGNILPVIDLVKFFGLPVDTPGSQDDSPGLIVYVRANLDEARRSNKTHLGQKSRNSLVEVLFKVSDVLIMETLTIRQKTADINMVHRLPQEYIRAVSERKLSDHNVGKWAEQKHVVVLNAEGLLSDPRMFVHQEVA